MARPKKDPNQLVITIEIAPERKVKLERALRIFGNKTLEEYLLEKTEEEIAKLETLLRSLA